MLRGLHIISENIRIFANELKDYKHYDEETKRMAL